MMRGVYVKVLTAGLIVLAASPGLRPAPPPARRVRPSGRHEAAPSAAALLRNDKVQEELKLTDDQKADLKKVTDVSESTGTTGQGPTTWTARR